MTSWIWLTDQLIHQNKECFILKAYLWTVHWKIFTAISVVSYIFNIFIWNAKHDTRCIIVIINFAGQLVHRVHQVLDTNKQFKGEAFVIFSNAENVETALQCTVGRKIKNKYIKIYRSSEKQLENCCNVAMTTDLSAYTRNEPVGSVPNIGKEQSLILDFPHIEFDDKVFRPNFQFKYILKSHLFLLFISNDK